MKIEHSHSMELSDVRARLQALGSYWSNRHGIALKWDGDSAVFEGRYKKLIKIAGKASFDAASVVFEGEDPGFALRGQATKYIRSKLEMYLDPSTPLDQLPTE